MTYFNRWRVILTAVITWRIGLFIVAAVASFLLPLKNSFVTNWHLTQIPYPEWMIAWANFDGVYYLTLVTDGYTNSIKFIQAFFPVYPLLMQPVWNWSHDIADIFLFAQLISIVSLVILLWEFHIISKVYTQYPKVHFLWLLLLILTFPTAYYFAGVYTESVFLALVLGAFLAANKKKWWLAGILAAVASGTRVVGILLVPALLIELSHQTKIWQLISSCSLHTCLLWSRKHLVSVCWILFGVTGLFLYSLFLWLHFGDPLYFFHVQSEFGAGRQESIILLPQVIWRYLKIFVTVPLDLRYLIYVEEFVAAVGGLTVLIFGWKKVRPSLLFFSFAVILVPTITGTFSSMARYILVAPAIFIILNSWLAAYPRMRIVWLLLSTSLLILNTMLFIRGYWVA